MRLLLFTTKNHIYANVIVKWIIQQKEYTVVEIIESDRIHPVKNKRDGLLLYIRRSGWYYTVIQMLKIVLYRLLSSIYGILPFARPDSVLYRYELIAPKENIPVREVNNINTD